MNIRLAPALLAGLALGIAPPAQAAPRADGFDPATMMRSSEVRPGMVGIGKSVFKGTRIEEFHVRLLGVLPRARVGTDMVLFQILDGPVVTGRTGVIAGMSGSPVYVKGRLLGAIAYGWSFTRLPIGGITPIEYMLRALEPAPPFGGPEGPPQDGPEGPQPEVPAGPKSVTLPAPIKVGGATIERITVERGFAPTAPIEAPHTLTLRPLGGFAMAVGFEGRALERLRSVLEPVGLTIMQGGGASTDFGNAQMLQPGAAMAIKLISGDIEAAGVGTLTYRKGDRVLAFGHPFMDLTDPTVDVPLAPASVISVLPSYMASAKLSSAGRTVGRINRDRAWGIGGEVGKPADMIPVTLQTEAGGRSRSFRVGVVRHRLLSAGLTASAVMSLLDQALGYVGEGTAKVTLTAVPRGRPPIHREELIYSRDISAALAAEPAEPLGAFTDTPFGTVEWERVDLKASIRPTHDSAIIERIYTTQTKAKAGQDLELNIVLRPYAKEKITRQVMLHIPEEMPTGMLRVGVSGGREAERMRGTLNLARIIPTNLDQLVQVYQTREAANQLVVQVALPTRGVRLPNDSLPSLPSSVADVLSATRSSAITRILDSLKVAEDTQWDVQGRQVIMVPVEGRPGAPKAAPGPPPQQPPEETGPPPGEEGPPGPEEPGDGGDFAADPAPAPASPLSAPAAEAPRAYDLDPVTFPDPAPAQNGGPPAGARRPGPRPSPPQAEKPAEKKPEAPKPVIRPPARWVQASQDDLGKGKLHGVALDSDGGLSLAPGDGPAWDLPEQGVWSLAAGDQVAYAGTGNRGAIYKLTPDGKQSVLYETGQAIVHSLLLDAAGNLYAGTSPRGLIYKIPPDGKGAVFYDTKQVYVWSLAFDAQGHLLAGTGPDGKLFRIGPDGKGEVIAAFQAPHVLSLAPGPKGEIYAGTGNNGVIYRLGADGATVTLFDVPGGQVHALVLGDQGELYAAVSPQGDLYRITPGGAAEPVFDTGDNVIFSMLRRDGLLYTATGTKGLVFRVRGEERADLLLKPETGSQALALAFDPAGDLYVGEANPSKVHRLGAQHQGQGSFESDVLDARATARWGTLAWYARTPKGAGVNLQTRSGNTADPKDRWSAWSAAISASGGPITSPPARYFQYRVSLSSDDPAANPRVSNIEINYLPKNRKPSVMVSAPKPGDWWSKQQKIEWKGEDPDKDTLLYDVYYSVDESDHWEPLKQGIKDTSYQWDTAKIEDGVYTTKVTATDRLTSPADPETDEDTALVGVDNTPPTAFVLRHTITVGPDRRVALRGDAWDQTSSVRGVDYRVDGKDWMAATPEAGLFDDHNTSFVLTTDALAPGDHAIEVRAFDQASNIGTDKVTVEVKAPAPPEKPPAPAPPTPPAAQPMPTTTPAAQPEAPAEAHTEPAAK